MKKLLSAILAISMVLAMLPSAAFAAEESDGTIRYVIKSSAISEDVFAETTWIDVPVDSDGNKVTDESIGAAAGYKIQGKMLCLIRL